MERPRQRYFHTLIHCQNAHDSWCWARQKPGLLCEWQDPRGKTITHCLPGTETGTWSRSAEYLGPQAGPQVGEMGCGCPRQPLKLPWCREVPWGWEVSHRQRSIKVFSHALFWGSFWRLFFTHAWEITPKWRKAWDNRMGFQWEGTHQDISTKTLRVCWQALSPLVGLRVELATSTWKFYKWQSKEFVNHGLEKMHGKREVIIEFRVA